MNNFEHGKQKRQEILDFIVSYIKQHGYPPTIREIGRGVNLRSTSTVHSHMQKMIASGVIETDDELITPRAIRVVGYEFKKVGE